MASVLYAFCVASFGTLVGAGIPSQAAAIQAVALGGFLLVFLLSGLIFPVENIPAGLRWVSNIVWGRYYIEIVRDALLQGGGWPAMWFSVLMIGVHRRGLFYILAWRKMRRMQVSMSMKPRLRRRCALIRKEFNQIRRDRRLAVSLIVPPTLQILLFGFALDATVSNLRLGVVDWSRTPESRELVATFTESKSFRWAAIIDSVNVCRRPSAGGKLDAGIVIPYDFARDIQRGRPVDVQILLNAVNANTATIAQGYAEGVIQTYNQTLAAEGIRPAVHMVGADTARPARQW